MKDVVGRLRRPANERGSMTSPIERFVPRPDVFTSVPAEEFESYCAPDQVKIAWTLETVPLGPALTRFATETRVVATDEQARRKFRRYWRLAGTGIILIRLLVLPALRRAAESHCESARTRA
jgi:hypothetical protein